MNVLFLGLTKRLTINQPGIYTDLLRQFVKHGHEVYVVTADEEAGKNPYTCSDEGAAHFLAVRTGRIQQTGFIEKGINTVLLRNRFLRAIRKSFEGIVFDLILYPTPPITFAGVVAAIKKRDKSHTYLLLKDIFPQNAVDMGIMSKSGLKGILYRYFRNQERHLYRISDQIGCMSPANVEYVIQHNPEVNPEKIEVCPNSLEPVDKSVDRETRVAIREKYGIPKDKTVFVYGGNLGRPQGIPYLIECLKKCAGIEKAYFLIVGDGTEYDTLEKYVHESRQANIKLMASLPRNDYDTMVGACDVGLIFLDHCFTIPNFPSRMLSYMQAKLPMLACTDPVSDMGKIIVDGGFGWWCESNNPEAFMKIVRDVVSEDLAVKRGVSYQYLIDHYTVADAYKTIMKSCGECE